MRALLAILTVGALTAVAAPAGAVVGGHDAPAGAFPSAAEITFGDASCAPGR